MNITPSLSIGIPGGEGRTGGQFARLFRSRGFTVDVTGYGSRQRNPELLQQCDVVIFAFPLEESVKLIEEEIVHAIRPDQLLLDVSSLKGKQVEMTLRGKGEVIGMHPLFAPTTDPENQTIMLCPTRSEEETVLSLEQTFQKMGLKTIRKTPEEHDRLMAFIQALPHLKSLLMADTLRQSGADIGEIEALCTPAYEIELNVIGRFLDDDPSLYGPIILQNPQTLQLLKTLRSLLDEYLKMAETTDLAAFHKKYDSLRAFFGPITAYARTRSEACIRTLSSLKTS